MFFEEKYISHVEGDVFAVMKLIKSKMGFSLNSRGKFHEYLMRLHNIPGLGESEKSGDDGQYEQGNGHRVEFKF